MILHPRFHAVVACRFALVVLLAVGVPGRPAPLRADSDPPAESAQSNDNVPKNVEQLRAIEEKFKKVVAQSSKSVVAIRLGPFRGSGVIVSPDGLVLTAGHVAGTPGRKVVFLTPDGKTLKGVTLGVFSSADAGMMKITDKGEWPFVELAPKGQIHLGAWCVTLGHPSGYEKGRPPAVRVGRVLRLEERVLQTDCPLIMGDSGGPLLDLEGKLIGINRRIGGALSMNYHVPIDVFHKHWERLKQSDAWADKMPLRDTPRIKAAFRNVIAEAAQCVVQIRCNRRNTVLGTIVGPDGWILTKASELKGRIIVRLPDGRDLAARTVGVDPRFDLAMLKIEAVDLPKISWSLKDPEVGQWVAAAGLDKDPLAVGVISLPRRGVPPTKGSLGITVGETKKGMTIISVLPRTPAAKAGLKKGDVITHINGRPVKSQEELTKIIKGFRPGTTLKLTLKRGKKTLRKSATLVKLITLAVRRREILNAIGVGISRRHNDFPVVLQHDSVLRPAHCGGPLVTLDGKAVGINVARGGRTETYCVPASTLIALMYDLMSGRLRPAPPEEKKKPRDEKKPDVQRKKEQPKKEEPKEEKPKEAEPKPKSDKGAAGDKPDSGEKSAKSAPKQKSPKKDAEKKEAQKNDKPVEEKDAERRDESPEASRSATSGTIDESPSPTPVGKPERI